ncbi:MAG: hypothetical protein AAB610_01120 [Patescibacteria group bacterium]
MKINQRHYTLILFALCTVICASFGYAFLYKKTVVQAEHYISAANEVANESIKKQNEQELTDIHKDTSVSREKLSSFFIPEETAVDFIERIEKVGVDSLTELEISAITNEESHIKAKVDIDGSWPGVMNALMLMENLPLGTTLDDIRLYTSGDLESSGKKKAASGHIWHLSLTIEALTKKSAK